jgi:hypothetical protein
MFQCLSLHRHTHKFNSFVGPFCRSWAGRNFNGQVIGNLKEGNVPNVHIKEAALPGGGR